MLEKGMPSPSIKHTHKHTFSFSNSLDSLFVLPFSLDIFHSLLFFTLSYSDFLLLPHFHAQILSKVILFFIFFPYSLYFYACLHGYFQFVYMQIISFVVLLNACCTCGWLCMLLKYVILCKMSLITCIFQTRCVHLI